MLERVPSIKRIIADTINEKAFGDPDALAGHIIEALGKNGLWIVPEDAGPADQPFDELKPEMRPQDTRGDGRDWKFETGEHGGDEPDNMPQAIKATDAEGRWAIFVPLTRGGRIVIPRPAPNTGAAKQPTEAKTDWDRLKSMTEAEIQAGIDDDPDAEPTDGAFWEDARLVWPAGSSEKGWRVKLTVDALF